MASPFECALLSAAVPQQQRSRRATVDSDCGSVDQSDGVCVGRSAEAGATACQPRQGRNGQSRRSRNASAAGAAPTPSVDAGNKHSDNNIGTVSQQDQTHKGRHSPSSGSMVDKVVAALCQGVAADGLALADLKAVHAEAMGAGHEEWQPPHHQHRHTTHASRRSSQSSYALSPRSSPGFRTPVSQRAADVLSRHRAQPWVSPGKGASSPGSMFSRAEAPLEPQPSSHPSPSLQEAAQSQPAPVVSPMSPAGMSASAPPSPAPPSTAATPPSAAGGHASVATAPSSFQAHPALAASTSAVSAARASAAAAAAAASLTSMLQPCTQQMTSAAPINNSCNSVACSGSSEQTTLQQFPSFCLADSLAAAADCSMPAADPTVDCESFAEGVALAHASADSTLSSVRRLAAQYHISPRADTRSRSSGRQQGDEPGSKSATPRGHRGTEPGQQRSPSHASPPSYRAPALTAPPAATSAAPPAVGSATALAGSLQETMGVNSTGAAHTYVPTSASPGTDASVGGNAAATFNLTVAALQQVVNALIAAPRVQMSEAGSVASAAASPSPAGMGQRLAGATVLPRTAATEAGHGVPVLQHVAGGQAVQRQRVTCPPDSTSSPSQHSRAAPPLPQHVPAAIAPDAAAQQQQQQHNRALRHQVPAARPMGQQQQSSASSAPFRGRTITTESGNGMAFSPPLRRAADSPQDKACSRLVSGNGMAFPLPSTLQQPQRQQPSRHAVGPAASKDCQIRQPLAGSDDIEQPADALPLAPAAERSPRPTGASGCSEGWFSAVHDMPGASSRRTTLSSTGSSQQQEGPVPAPACLDSPAASPPVSPKAQERDTSGGSACLGPSLPWEQLKQLGHVQVVAHWWEKPQRQHASSGGISTVSAPVSKGGAPRAGWEEEQEEVLVEGGCGVRGQGIEAEASSGGESGITTSSAPRITEGSHEGEDEDEDEGEMLHGVEGAGRDRRATDCSAFSGITSSSSPRGAALGTHMAVHTGRAEGQEEPDLPLGALLPAPLVDSAVQTGPEAQLRRQTACSGITDTSCPHEGEDMQASGGVDMEGLYDGEGSDGCRSDDGSGTAAEGGELLHWAGGCALPRVGSAASNVSGITATSLPDVVGEEEAGGDYSPGAGGTEFGDFCSPPSLAIATASDQGVDDALQGMADAPGHLPRSAQLRTEVATEGKGAVMGDALRVGSVSAAGVLYTSPQPEGHLGQRSAGVDASVHDVSPDGGMGDGGEARARSVRAVSGNGMASSPPQHGQEADRAGKQGVSSPGLLVVGRESIPSGNGMAFSPPQHGHSVQEADSAGEQTASSLGLLGRESLPSGNGMAFIPPHQLGAEAGTQVLLGTRSTHSRALSAASGNGMAFAHPNQLGKQEVSRVLLGEGSTCSRAASGNGMASAPPQSYSAGSAQPTPDSSVGGSVVSGAPDHQLSQHTYGHVRRVAIGTDVSASGSAANAPTRSLSQVSAAVSAAEAEQFDQGDYIERPSASCASTQVSEAGTAGNAALQVSSKRRAPLASRASSAATPHEAGPCHPQPLVSQSGSCIGLVTVSQRHSAVSVACSVTSVTHNAPVSHGGYEADCSDAGSLASSVTAASCPRPTGPPSHPGSGISCGSAGDRTAGGYSSVRHLSSASSFCATSLASLSQGLTPALSEAGASDQLAPLPRQIEFPEALAAGGGGGGAAVTDGGVLTRYAIVSPHVKASSWAGEAPQGRRVTLAGGSRSRRVSFADEVQQAPADTTATCAAEQGTSDVIDDVSDSGARAHLSPISPTQRTPCTATAAGEEAEEQQQAEGETLRPGPEQAPSEVQGEQDKGQRTWRLPLSLLRSLRDTREQSSVAAPPNPTRPLGSPGLWRPAYELPFTRRSSGGGALGALATRTAKDSMGTPRALACYQGGRGSDGGGEERLVVLRPAAETMAELFYRPGMGLRDLESGDLGSLEAAAAAAVAAVAAAVQALSPARATEGSRQVSEVLLLAASEHEEGQKEQHGQREKLEGEGDQEEREEQEGQDERQGLEPLQVQLQGGRQVYGSNASSARPTSKAVTVGGHSDPQVRPTPLNTSAKAATAGGLPASSSPLKRSSPRSACLDSVTGSSAAMDAAGDATDGGSSVARSARASSSCPETDTGSMSFGGSSNTAPSVASTLGGAAAAPAPASAAAGPVTAPPASPRAATHGGWQSQPSQPPVSFQGFASVAGAAPASSMPRPGTPVRRTSPTKSGKDSDAAGASLMTPAAGLRATGSSQSPMHKPVAAVPMPSGLAAGNVVTGNVATAADLQRLKEEILLGLRQALAEALARIRQQQQQQGATSGLRSLPGSFSSASTQAAPRSPSGATAPSPTYGSNSSSSRGGAGVGSLTGSTEEAGGPLDGGSGVQQQAAAASSNAGLLQSLDEQTVRSIICSAYAKVQQRLTRHMASAPGALTAAATAPASPTHSPPAPPLASATLRSAPGSVSSVVAGHAASRNAAAESRPPSDSEALLQREYHAPELAPPALDGIPFLATRPRGVASAPGTLETTFNATTASSALGTFPPASLGHGQALSRRLSRTEGGGASTSASSEMEGLSELLCALVSPLTNIADLLISTVGQVASRRATRRGSTVEIKVEGEGQQDEQDSPIKASAHRHTIGATGPSSPLPPRPAPAAHSPGPKAVATATTTLLHSSPGCSSRQGAFNSPLVPTSMTRSSPGGVSSSALGPSPLASAQVPPTHTFPGPGSSAPQRPVSDFGQLLGRVMLRASPSRVTSPGSVWAQQEASMLLPPATSNYPAHPSPSRLSQPQPMPLSISGVAQSHITGAEGQSGAERRLQSKEDSTSSLGSDGPPLTPEGSSCRGGYGTDEEPCMGFLALHHTSHLPLVATLTAAQQGRRSQQDSCPGRAPQSSAAAAAIEAAAITAAATAAATVQVAPEDSSEWEALASTATRDAARFDMGPCADLKVWRPTPQQLGPGAYRHTTVAAFSVPESVPEGMLSGVSEDSSCASLEAHDATAVVQAHRRHTSPPCGKGVGLAQLESIIQELKCLQGQEQQAGSKGGRGGSAGNISRSRRSSESSLDGDQQTSPSAAQRSAGASSVGGGGSSMRADGVFTTQAGVDGGCGEETKACNKEGKAWGEGCEAWGEEEMEGRLQSLMLRFAALTGALEVRRSGRGDKDTTTIISASGSKPDGSGSRLGSSSGSSGVASISGIRGVASSGSGRTEPSGVPQRKAASAHSSPLAPAKGTSPMSTGKLPSAAPVHQHHAVGSTATARPLHWDSGKGGESPPASPGASIAGAAWQLPSRLFSRPWDSSSSGAGGSGAGDRDAAPQTGATRPGVWAGAQAGLGPDLAPAALSSSTRTSQIEALLKQAESLASTLALHRQRSGLDSDSTPPQGATGASSGAPAATGTSLGSPASLGAPAGTSVGSRSPVQGGYGRPSGWKRVGNGQEWRSYALFTAGGSPLDEKAQATSTAAQQHHHQHQQQAVYSSVFNLSCMHGPQLHSAGSAGAVPPANRLPQALVQGQGAFAAAAATSPASNLSPALKQEQGACVASPVPRHLADACLTLSEVDSSGLYSEPSQPSRGGSSRTSREAQVFPAPRQAGTGANKSQPIRDFTVVENPLFDALLRNITRSLRCTVEETQGAMRGSSGGMSAGGSSGGNNGNCKSNSGNGNSGGNSSSSMVEGVCDSQHSPDSSSPIQPHQVPSDTVQPCEQAVQASAAANCGAAQPAGISQGAAAAQVQQAAATAAQEAAMLSKACSTNSSSPAVVRTLVGSVQGEACSSSAFEVPHFAPAAPCQPQAALQQVPQQLTTTSSDPMPSEGRPGCPKGLGFGCRGLEGVGSACRASEPGRAQVMVQEDSCGGSYGGGSEGGCGEAAGAGVNVCGWEAGGMRQEELLQWLLDALEEEAQEAQQLSTLLAEEVQQQQQEQQGHCQEEQAAQGPHQLLAAGLQATLGAIAMHRPSHFTPPATAPLSSSSAAAVPSISESQQQQQQQQLSGPWPWVDMAPGSSAGCHILGEQLLRETLEVPYGAPTSPRFQPLRPFLSDGGTSGRPSRRATVNSASIPSLSPRITLGSCGGALIDLPDPSHGGAGGVLGLTPDSLKIIISGGGVEGMGVAPTGRSAASAAVTSAAVIVTAHPLGAARASSHTAAAAAAPKGGPAAHSLGAPRVAFHNAATAAAAAAKGGPAAAAGGPTTKAGLSPRQAVQGTKPGAGLSPRPSPSRLPGVVSGANRSPSRIPAPPLNASASSPLQKTLGKSPHSHIPAAPCPPPLSPRPRTSRRA